VAFPDEWRVLLTRRWPLWSVLTGDERERLEMLALSFIDAHRWEASRGFTITDEMRVLIAAQACVLLLGFQPEIAQGIDPYRRVSSVIVHPSTVVMHGQRTTGTQGVMADGPYALLGEAHMRGPVLISWAAALSDVAHPRRGRNVVIHEFAHQLDMLDGIIDGTPPLGDDDAHARWVEVCTREFQALRDGHSSPILDRYGATDQGEFFAVATELLFTRPAEMHAELPELYEVVAGFYRQDLAARFPKTPAGSARPDQVGGAPG
jgi:hypothetical protein